ncbi:BZ3500_MvSof-1268-A1-R1_Chr3-1g05449 [Microbotryum saponariae]|uniref:BZ3500_MvSof-1268-A1-R1_Chr3-1g05449 protein n=1 Tax=Microbotryum saponariae TaxID=289078 RepID=A0A2X0LHI8_9BASI|nr:BZ3500_MvSof-1268-A1-R1_Chr3-1g05449 [Microbotryum saponariae]SDA04640.1 BZ3501_MvSof-1269-A2-R1_Chr3-1g05120 [Microbotryum saponariae]
MTVPTSPLTSSQATQLLTLLVHQVAAPHLVSLLSQPSLRTTLYHLLSTSHPGDPHRPLLHALLDRLSHLSGTFTYTLCGLYALHFGPTDRARVESVLDRVLRVDSTIHDQVLNTAPLVFASHSSNETDDEWQLCQLSMAMIRVSSTIARAYARHPEVWQAFHKLYQSTISSGQIEQQLHQKVFILSTVEAMLEAAFWTPLRSAQNDQDVHVLLVQLDTVLRPVLHSSQESSSSSSIPKAGVDAPLLADLETLFSTSATLQRSSGRASANEIKAKIDRLVQGLRGLQSREVGEWFKRLQSLRPVSRPAHDSVPGKGKGKVVEQEVLSPEQEASRLYPAPKAISQILDVLPDLSPNFLRTCLLHPRFSSTSAPSEAVIASIFEESLPSDLDELLRNPVPSTKIEEPTKIPTQSVPPRPNDAHAPIIRSNIFDSASLNPTLLKTNRSTVHDQNESKQFLADQSFMTEQLKALIIERAERESSDSENDDDEEVVDDDEEDRFRAVERSFEVRDRNEGIETPLATTTSGANTPLKGSVAASDTSTLNAFNNATLVKLLERTYLSDPALFDRSSATRKSKMRAELKQKTGLGDEQLEGWRIMLERDPKRKEKVLERRMVEDVKERHAGPGSEEDDSDEEDEDGEARPNAGGRGGGNHDQGLGRGRGRGRGGGGGGGGARGGRGGGRGGRGDGNRAAHVRRQRGNDKKMAKMGAGPPL